MIAESGDFWETLLRKGGGKVLVALLFVAVGLYLVRRRKSRINQWAQALGLQPVAGGFAGEVHGLPCSVMIRHDKVEPSGVKRGGYDVNIWVEVVVPVPLPAGLRITARRGPAPRTGQLLQTGDVATDNAFYVVADDRDAAIALLSNRGLISVLLVHGRTYPQLTVEENRVRLRATRFQTTTEDPRQFFETATLAAVRGAEALLFAASGQPVQGHDAAVLAGERRGVRLPTRRKP